MKQIYTPVYSNLLVRIRQARIRRGLTMRAAARQLGRSRQWYGKVEGGQIMLDLVHLIFLCRAVGLRADDEVRQMEKELAP